MGRPKKGTPRDDDGPARDVHTKEKKMIRSDLEIAEIFDTIKFVPPVTMEDLDALHRQVKKLPWSGEAIVDVSLSDSGVRLVVRVGGHRIVRDFPVV